MEQLVVCHAAYANAAATTAPATALINLKQPMDSNVTQAMGSMIVRCTNRRALVSIWAHRYSRVRTMAGFLQFRYRAPLLSQSSLDY